MAPRRPSSTAYIPLGGLTSPPDGSQPLMPVEPSPSLLTHPNRDGLSPFLGYQASPGFRGAKTPSVYSTSTITRHPKLHRYTWWFEALCLVGSGIAVVMTAIVLRYFDGKKIPPWASAGSGLSLNSILSVLSTMSRSSLLIPLDTALGQLMWLAFSEKARSLAETELYNEASRGPWGAIRLIWKRKGRGITSLGCFLMVMALGIGFTQQQLISYPTVTVLIADSSGSTGVGCSSEVYDNYQETSDTLDGTLSLVVDFAVSSALFSSLNHHVVHNPLYRCDSGNCVYPEFTTLGICSHCDDQKDQIVTRCNSENDHCWSDYHGLEGHSWRGKSEYSTTLNQTAALSTLGSSIITSYTLNVSMTNWPPSYTAFQCEIMWCTRTFRANVTRSDYVETEVGESTVAEMQDDGSAIFSYDNGTKHFRVTQNAQTAFKSLGKTLTGWSRRSETGQWIHSSPLFSGIASFATADMTVGGAHLHRHKKHPVAVIADGMSTALRGNLSIPGDLVERYTIINVRWWWLLYPSVMWILSAIFLGGVVWETRKKEHIVGAWGCSFIALLLWGVEQNVRERVGDWSAEGMEALAKNVKVALVRDGEGWRMKED